MKITKTLGMVFLGSALLFSSCKKDDAASSTPVCKVNKAFYYAPNSSTPSDTATYTYDGNKVSKLRIGGDDLVFEYTGNNISRRSYVVPGSPTPEGYDQVTYNSDGTISRIESFGTASEAGYQAFERVDFTYSSGNLARLTTYDLTSGSAEKTLEFAYTYSGHNITRVDETDFSMAVPATLSYQYSYDGNDNYYK